MISVNFFSTKASLERFRSRIDCLDRTLISLLSERFRKTRLIGSLKESIGLPIEDQEREQELRSWVLAVSEGKLEPEFLGGFMSRIFEHARSEQEGCAGAVPSHLSIDSLRSEIQALDEEITRNLVERFDVTREVGHFKAQNNIDAVDPKRERTQLGRATLLAAKHGLDSELVEALLGLVFGCVVQEHERIARTYR